MIWNFYYCFSSDRKGDDRLLDISTLFLLRVENKRVSYPKDLRLHEMAGEAHDEIDHL